MSTDKVQRVRWTPTGSSIERVGWPLSVINPGEIPQLPPGIAKHRRGFIARPSEAVRMLVVVWEDGIGDRYYAPRVGSLRAASEPRAEATAAAQP